MTGQGGNDEGWTKVRRRKNLQPHNRFPEHTSLYVLNIPVGIRKGDLWKKFKPPGKDEKTWSRWFKELRYGVGEMEDFKTLAWLKVVGLPVTMESMENLETIGNTWGRTLEVDELTWNKFNMSHNRLCVLTSQRKLINEELSVSLSDKKHTIGVTEVEVLWNSFKITKGNSMDVRIIVEDYADLEDEDSKSDDATTDEKVEDTVNGDHVPQSEEEMEEGEFRQEHIPNTPSEKVEAPELRNVAMDVPTVNARVADYLAPRFLFPFPAVAVANSDPRGSSSEHSELQLEGLSRISSPTAVLAHSQILAQSTFQRVLWILERIKTKAVVPPQDAERGRG
ncbi:hypothetical protein LXL04_005346 [Taraxacum kok-saghyz]